MLSNLSKTLRRLKIHAYLLLIILGLAAFLRFYNLGQESFWHDEVFTAMLAKGSVFEIIARVWEGMKGSNRRFIFQHLSHIFISFMYTFGSSQFLLLLPGAILAVLTIPLQYFFGRVLFNSKVGLMAAFLLVISPFHIYYSQELSYYSYLVFFSLLSYTLFYFLIQKPSFQRAFWFVFFTTLSLLTHLTAYFVLASEIIFAFFLLLTNYSKVFHFLGDKLKRKPKTVIFFVFLGAILFFLVYKQTSSAIEQFLQLWVKPGKQIAGLEFNWNFVVGSVSLATTTSKSFLYFYIICLLLGLIPTKHTYRKVLFCALILLFPFVWLFFTGLNYFFDLRFVIFALPVFFLLVSLGLWRLINLLEIVLLRRFNYLRIILGVALLGVFMIGTIPNISFFYNTRRLMFYSPNSGLRFYGITDDFRSLASAIEKKLNSEDLIVIDQNMNVAGFMFYYQGKNHFTTYYTFEKKPLFTKRLGANGHGWFVCHEDCQMKDIIKNDYPALDYIYQEKIEGNFEIYKIIPRRNLVFVSNLEEFVDNSGWQVVLDNHYLFDEFLKIDGYFPWQGRVMRLYRVSTDTLGAEISYEIEIPQNGSYEFFLNVFNESLTEGLGLQIDGRKMSKRWVKRVIRSYNRTVDFSGPNIYFSKGKHAIKFINYSQKTPTTIHYFFLVASQRR